MIQQDSYSPLTTVPIVGWIVQYKLSGGSDDPRELTTVNITNAATLSFVISNLTAGTEYCARVAADTEMGLGPLSEYQKTSTRYYREFFFFNLFLHATKNKSSHVLLMPRGFFLKEMHLTMYITQSHENSQHSVVQLAMVQLYVNW